MTPIYHITHLKNLPAMVALGHLCCDIEIGTRNISPLSIAHEHIKARRARKKVTVSPGGVVAHYVPFYFAPRSPMLYTIHQGNVAGFSGGQAQVVYLVSSVERVLKGGFGYCFTDGHAEMGLTLFFNDWSTQKQRVPWKVMAGDWWNDTPGEPDRKRQRQAEFLVRGAFPWSAIQLVGVYDEAARV